MWIHKILYGQTKSHLNTNLGLESLVASADGAFRVIAQSVSAALAWTSGGHWFKVNGSCQTTYRI